MQYYGVFLTFTVFCYRLDICTFTDSVKRSPHPITYEGDKAMGLFEAKYCDICGEKIKFLGNKKLEDGRMCKSCESKLSPFFTERRHTTLEDIKAQLEYREDNKAAVETFNATRTLGKRTKLMIDEAAGKFIVSSQKNYKEENPDVVGLDQITDVLLDIKENKTEKTWENSKGDYVSYNPPRYDYHYDFDVLIRVNATYFDEIRIPLDSYVEVDEEAVRYGTYSPDYNENVSLGNEIKEALLAGRSAARQDSVSHETARAVQCPLCGATTIPDKHGCCEYCGGAIV